MKLKVKNLFKGVNAAQNFCIRVMKVKPIKNYKSPNYPLKEQVLQNHKLLQKLPQRWKLNVCVCTAMSSISIIMLTACKTQSQKDVRNNLLSSISSVSSSNKSQTSSKNSSSITSSNKSNTDNSRTTSSQKSSNNSEMSMTRTAGIQIISNITLTEDEAIYIINDEALKQGITFSNNEKKIIDIDLPISTTCENGKYIFKMAPNILKLDGFNAIKCWV